MMSTPKRADKRQMKFFGWTGSADTNEAYAKTNTISVTPHTGYSKRGGSTNSSIAGPNETTIRRSTSIDLARFPEFAKTIPEKAYGDPESSFLNLRTGS